MEQPVSESDQGVLAQAFARIDRADLAGRVVAACRAQIPGYHRLPEAIVAGKILEIAQLNVELFFRALVNDRDPTDEELEPFRESAKNRGWEGMPLEDLLQAYRLGGRLAWEDLVESSSPAEHRALLRGAELVMRYIDRVSTVVAQAYLEERQHLVSEEERRMRAFVEAVLDPASTDFELRHLADRAGAGMEDHYRPFVQAVGGAPARAHSQLAFSLRARGVLALTEGDRVAGLAPPGIDGSAFTQGRALLAVGEPTPRAELAIALDELRLRVDLGLRFGKSGRLSAGALLPELLLASSPRLAATLRDQVLGPLEEYAERRRSELVETLDSFVACGLDRRRTSERIGVHPNTLDYRLRRVQELTGLDVGRPDDLVLVTLALKQKRLEGPQGAIVVTSHS